MGLKELSKPRQCPRYRPRPHQIARFLVAQSQLILQPRSVKLKKNWKNRNQKTLAQEHIQKDLMIVLRNQQRRNQILSLEEPDLLIQQSGSVKLRKNCAKLISTAKNRRIQIISTKTTATITIA